MRRATLHGFAAHVGVWLAADAGEVERDEERADVLATLLRVAGAGEHDDARGLEAEGQRLHAVQHPVAPAGCELLPRELAVFVLLSCELEFHSR
jgi:hypothetical protein